MANENKKAPSHCCFCMAPADNHIEETWLYLDERYGVCYDCAKILQAGMDDAVKMLEKIRARAAKRLKKRFEKGLEKKRRAEFEKASGRFFGEWTAIFAGKGKGKSALIRSLLVDHVQPSSGAKHINATELKNKLAQAAADLRSQDMATQARSLEEAAVACTEAEEKLNSNEEGETDG